ncbi:MAG: YihY/virulence factor BrkB family protein [Chlorobi bacterium]|nr:YihY/virulence factor BrkB family protein [Chlorobiota bacterium]
MKLEIKDQDYVKILKFMRIKSKKFHRFVAGVEEVFDRVEHNHSFLMAAGIAFNILLYLIPLLLVAIYIVNVVFGIGSVTEFLTTTLENVLPPDETTTGLLQKTIEEVYFILAKSSLAGWIGIVTLLWLSSILYSSLRTGLNTIFNIKTPKTYFFYKFRDMFLIIMIAVLVMLSSFFFPLLSVVENTFFQYVPESMEFIASTLYVTTLSLVTSFVLFYLLFRFVPNERVPRKIRIISTGMSVLMIEGSRRVFSWYILSISAYGKFYGTYAILASLALWVYYLVLIILLSAEISQFIYDLRKKDELS